MKRIQYCLLLALVLMQTQSHLLASVAHSPKSPSIETFMQIGSATSPQISSDGEEAFFRSWMSGVDQVYHFEDMCWPYQLTAFVDGIDFYRISPDGKLVIVGASSGGSEQSDLYVFDTLAGTGEALLVNSKVRYGSPVWDKNGERIYYASNEENGRDFFIYGVNVYQVGLKDPEPHKVWDKPGWNAPADISRDGSKLLVEHYESNVNSDLYLVDVGSGEARLLTPHKEDYIFWNGRLSPDGSTVYFITNMNPDGLAKVAKMSLGDLKIEFINGDSKWESEELEISPDGRYLAWVENVNGYGVLYFEDLTSHIRRSLERLTGIVSDLTIAMGGKMLFTFTSASQPPDVWEYDIDEDSLKQLTFSTYAGIDKSLFVEPKLIRYKSFDGLEVPAFLYLPRDWDGKPIPFVIHAHGGPEGQFRPSFIRHFQYLILNGYGVLAPNIRGSAGYGRAYIKLDDYKKRKDSIRDIGAAAEWLIANGYTEPKKVAIKGASYGGYVTLASLVEYPDIFGAGIDQVGIANFVTFLRNTAEYRRALREAEYGPLTDEEFLKEISPITHAERIKAPLLVVHGENDPRVPVEEARQIAETIKARGGKVELLIFPDEGHGISKLSNRLTFYRRMVEFLDEHLKR